MSSTFQIQSIRSLEILDSRGNPTLRTRVRLQTGCEGIADVPSGASTGKTEALELRDGGTRYGGKGVQRAIRNVQGILHRKLRGKDARQQEKIDRIMLEADGSAQKKKIGANAILSVSLACARAAANARKKPLWLSLRQLIGEKNRRPHLPVPFVNVLNGGAHANNGVDLQEYWIVPSRRHSTAKQIEVAASVYHHLKELLEQKHQSSGLGDEGGMAPNLTTNEEGFQYLVAASFAAGVHLGEDVVFGMDAGASQFFHPGQQRYVLNRDGKNFTSKEMIAWIQNLQKKYPIHLIEDGLAEEDWGGWQLLMSACGASTTLIGDDLFTTHRERLERGIREQSANAILVKPNQVGTLTETLQTIQLAKQHRWSVTLSHRSGDTADSFIVDLGVAVQADYLKIGSVARGERTEKYNRLLEIAQQF